LNHIGKYTNLIKIGQGATSHVYKGHDAVLKRDVAVKVIASEVGSDETLRKRFQREAQSAAVLNHPHIITVYDFGEEKDKLYIAMELLDGLDLKEALAQGKLKGLEHKLDVMDQICDGLAFAHANGVFHRDLKPANLHLLRNGQVKIMDFGLARLSGSDMTKTGLVMGTPHYMSPEQVRGEHVDARSDVFALGCVFYEILTGRKPFDAESLHSVLYKVMQAEPPPARDLVPDLPFVIVQVLEKSLAKRPADRFPDAGDFRSALERAREALAGGRGDEPLTGLSRPAPVAPALTSTATRPTADPMSGSHPSTPSAVSAERAPASADSVSSPSASRRPHRPDRPSGSRSRSGASPAPAAAGPGPGVWSLEALGVVVVVLLLVFFLRGAPAPQAPAPADNGQISTLAKELADTEVRNARKKLEAGDYEDAARRAERALKFDPGSAEAKEVLGAAKKAQDQIDAAVTAARSGAAGGEARAAADAFWGLLEVAPDHAAAAEIAPSLDGGYRARADEARSLMAEAQKATEKTPPTRPDLLKEAASLARDGDAAVKAKTYAQAARAFMRARDRYKRAVR
jgi:serine/threonine-protein kinase